MTQVYRKTRSLGHAHETALRVYDMGWNRITWSAYTFFFFLPPPAVTGVCRRDLWPRVGNDFELMTTETCVLAEDRKWCKLVVEVINVLPSPPPYSKILFYLLLN